jgi:hypothetical protein
MFKLFIVSSMASTRIISPHDVSQVGNLSSESTKLCDHQPVRLTPRMQDSWACFASQSAQNELRRFFKLSTLRVVWEISDVLDYNMMLSGSSAKAATAATDAAWMPQAGAVDAAAWIVSFAAAVVL